MCTRKSKELNFAKNDVNRKLGKKAWSGRSVQDAVGASGAKAQSALGESAFDLGIQ